MRSKWKLPTFLFNLKNLCQKKGSLFINRSVIITSIFIDKRIKIHTGKLYENFRPKLQHQGLRFGEFIITKKLGAQIHISKKNKKKKK